MSEQFKFTIDGQSVVAEEGMTILDVALANDIYIPHLCHHPDLIPVGVCECVVLRLMVDGWLCPA